MSRDEYPYGIPSPSTDVFPKASTGPDDVPPSMFFEDITWTCHICSDERPDRFISVHKQPVLSDLGNDLIERNIRYCNDRASCHEGAINLEPLDFRRDSK